MKKYDIWGFLLVFLFSAALIAFGVLAVKEMCDIWEPGPTVHEYNVSHYSQEEVDMLEQVSRRGF